jgi:hypothetical protein
MQTMNTIAEEPEYRPITLLDKWRFVMQAIPDKRLTASDLRCVVAIADCYNSGKGRAWPSYSYIGRQTGLSRSAIARSVGKLHALDIIHKVSGGTGRANTYRPAFREPPGEINPADTADTSVTHETSVTHDTTPVSCMTPDPSHPCDTIPLTPRSISVGEYRGIPTDGGAARAGGALRPVGGAPANDGFEQFWANYPKREGRTQAKQAYSRVVAAGIAPDTLIAKARQYAEAKADVDAKWLKMPANWLKEECWLEDPQPPRPREPKPARAAQPGAKRQKPARTAEAAVKKPVVNSARPVVKKPTRAKPVANGQTDKGRASLKRELSLPPPTPLPIAEPPKPAPKPVTSALGQVPFTTDAIADGSQLPRPAIRADAPKPIPMPPPVAHSLTAMKPNQPPKSRPRIGGEAIAGEPPKPAPPSPPASKRLGPRVWDEKYGFGRVVQSGDDGVLVMLDDYTELAFDPARLKLFSVSHPEHGHGFVLAVGGAEYNSCNHMWEDAHADEELAEVADGELIIDFGRRGKRRVNAAEVSTTNLCGVVSEPLPKLAPAAATAPKPVIASALEQAEKSFTPGATAAEAPKPVPASQPPVNPAIPSMQAPWFEPGQSVLHGEQSTRPRDRLGALGQVVRPFSPGAIAAEPPNPAPDSIIASALRQVAKPFTPGAIAAEAPKPLGTDHSATCFIRTQEDAENRAEREAAVDAITKQLSLLIERLD